MVFLGKGFIGRSRGGKCMGWVFAENTGLGNANVLERGNLVVRREAAAPRRLRKRGNGAKSPPAFPNKTSCASRPDAAFPRRCRALLATALRGVASRFCGWLVCAPCAGLCGFVPWCEARPVNPANSVNPVQKERQDFRDFLDERDRAARRRAGFFTTKTRRQEKE